MKSTKKTIPSSDCFSNAARWEVRTPGNDSCLGVDAQQKVTFLVRFERRRYDAVGAWRQFVSAGHLTHVDELRTFGDRFVALEEVLVEQSAVWVRQLQRNARLETVTYDVGYLLNGFRYSMIDDSVIEMMAQKYNMAHWVSAKPQP